MFKRSSGVLAHVTSLPSPHGVGTMGKAAYDFVDFLADAHQTYWQVLPLGHTGFGDSPYQCFSTAAGNPYLIDLDLLVEDGLLTEAEVRAGDFQSSPDEADFEQLADTRWPLFRKAFSRVDEKMRAEIDAFTEENAEWLPDYALFMSLKEEKYHHMPVYMWPEKAVRDRKPAALKKVTEELRDEIDFRIFLQYIFFKQWKALRAYANEKGIRIIGDIPIYVSADSVDVWTHPTLFKLKADRSPKLVAGVPPDYYSATGQLWGNPVYDWEAHRAEGYAWWIWRMKSNMALFDVIRLDHFRGFAAYWEVKATEETAINGHWRKGPGMELFKAMEKALGPVPLIAEDLGVQTDEVRALLAESGFPGMKVLIFGFTPDEDNEHLRLHLDPRLADRVRADHGPVHRAGKAVRLPLPAHLAQRGHGLERDQERMGLARAHRDDHPAGPALARRGRAHEHPCDHWRQELALARAQRGAQPDGLLHAGRDHQNLYAVRPAHL